MTNSILIYAIISYASWACFSLSCYFLYKAKTSEPNALHRAKLFNIIGLYIAVVVMAAFEKKYFEAPALLLIQNAFLLFAPTKAPAPESKAT